MRFLNWLNKRETLKLKRSPPDRRVAEASSSGSSPRSKFSLPRLQGKPVFSMSPGNNAEMGWFAARCSATTVLSYVLAQRLGLPYPVWAPISALIVSQENLKTTWHAVTGRIFGTCLGVVIALMVARLGQFMALSEWIQLSIGAAACAVCAKGRPALRVCLWTCPLVLLTQTPSLPTEMTGFFRGSEVIVGALVGGGVHLVEDWLKRIFIWARSYDPDQHPRGSDAFWWNRDSEE